MAGKHDDDTSMNGHPRIFLSLPELLKYEDVLGPVSNHIGSTDKQHVKDEGHSKYVPVFIGMI